MNVLCIECNKNVATEKVIIDSTVEQKFHMCLCEECAKINNFFSKQEEPFEIVGLDCEINGYRLYLYDQDTSERVRLSQRTIEAVEKAVTLFREGRQNGTLYRVPV